MLKEKTHDEIISENLNLVHSLSRRFIGRGIEYDDLFQAGCVGLVKAAHGFEAERGLCFSTYAVPVILGELRRLFRDGGSVKVSRSIKELFLRVGREKQSLEVKLGREPTVSELSFEMGVSAEDISEAICACQPTVSLTPEGDENKCETDLPEKGPEEQLINKLLVDNAFKKLDEAERRLIIYRYYNYLTQSKTAELLGMSQVQVSRLEKKILQKLRGIIGEI